MYTGSNNHIEALLSKYLQGKLTSAESKRFYDLFADPVNEIIIKDIMSRHLSDFEEDESFNQNTVDFESIYGNIVYELKQKDIHERERSDYERRTRIKRTIVFASSMAAVFLIAFFLGKYNPGRQNSSNAVPEILSYNEIKAPFGSKSEIKLPDGTRVILNAGSTLKYRSDFNTNNRDLALVGEAYFKVARNPEIPLIVNAGKINIKAIGTEFNIKAYEEEGVIETTLIEGKIEISQKGRDDDEEEFIDLIPNQKAIFIKDAERFFLEKLKTMDSALIKPVTAINQDILISPKVNVSQVVAWTVGKLILRGENLENLCIELERKYDVKIVFVNEEIKKYRFTGVLLDETLEQVLSVIKLTAPIKYSIEGKTVYMNSDSRQVKDYSRYMKK